MKRRTRLRKQGLPADLPTPRQEREAARQKERKAHASALAFRFHELGLPQWWAADSAILNDCRTYGLDTVLHWIVSPRVRHLRYGL